MTGALRLGDAWRQASARIGRQDARRLLEQVTGCSHADLIAAPERASLRSFGSLARERSVRMRSALSRRPMTFASTARSRSTRSSRSRLTACAYKRVVP